MGNKVLGKKRHYMEYYWSNKNKMMIQNTIFILSVHGVDFSLHMACLLSIFQNKNGKTFLLIN